MSDDDSDAFAYESHILPETTTEWEVENGLNKDPLLPDEADEFFGEEDVGEQISMMIEEVRGEIDFDTAAAEHAREYYEHERRKLMKGSPRKLRFERLEDRPGGDPSNQGEVLE